MKIINDNLSIQDFKAWSGGIDTQEKILSEGKAQEFDNLIEDLYPNGLTDTNLNDLLWFEEEWIYETLGIKEEVLK
jgi:hypothetical protein